MFLMLEDQGSRCSCLNPPLLIIYEAHGMLYSDTRNFTITRRLKKIFASVSNEICSVLVTRFLVNKW